MSPERVETAEREYRLYDIYRPAGGRPFGISGCVRVRNDDEFLEESVVSHLQWLDEVVLVVQPSEDKTMKVAEHLAIVYADKVRLTYYPFAVAPPGSDKHKAFPPNSVYSMVHLTNWALAQCRFSWIAKIEADVIALPNFKDLRREVESHPDADVYYGRVGFNLAGRHRDEFSTTNPRNAGWDVGVFPNHPDWHCIKGDLWETMNTHQRSGNLANMGWSFLHLKRCKRSHVKSEKEEWGHITRDAVREALGVYNRAHPYPGKDDPAGSNLLFEAIL